MKEDAVPSDKNSAEPAAFQVALHEKYVAAAWNALDQQDYKEAMALAEQCIDLFQAKAEELQEKIKDMQIPVGAVSDHEKTKIFSIVC